MQTHVRSCIEKSKRLHNSSVKGRGLQVTLLSKTRVNIVIEAIRRLIKKDVSADVKTAGLYSIQIDSTQDTTAKDQCSVIMRYVTDTNIKEQMIAFRENKHQCGKLCW